MAATPGADGRLPDPPGAAEALAGLVRDGFVESRHSGHLAIATADGTVLAAVGDPQVTVYPRSSLKPFQAAAVLDVLSAAGWAPGAHGPAGTQRAAEVLGVGSVAISAASHSGSTEHQVEAARLLALAGLDEAALQCPPALPSDLAALRASRGPETLAHNCSGKHAAFLLAQVAAGDDPARYRDPASVVQQAVTATIAACTAARLTGPGVDGCGAPAWRLPLAALAAGFALLAAPDAPPGLRCVAEAMRARPDLVGSMQAADTLLMLAHRRVVAKRGAEAVLGAGTLTGGRAVGIAVKVADGGTRATGPVVAAVLAALGSPVPDDLVAPPVLGGGQIHGRLEVSAAVTRAAAEAARTPPARP